MMRTPSRLVRYRVNILLGLVGLTCLLGLPDYSRRLIVNSAPAQSDPITNSDTTDVARRANPWVRLSDLREVQVSFAAASIAEKALQQNLAEPLSLASADFDEDGTPDLITGYRI